jgi:hypothetical protein
MRFLRGIKCYFAGHWAGYRKDVNGCVTGYKCSECGNEWDTESEIK